jgi:hypothetical protein
MDESALEQSPMEQLREARRNCDEARDVWHAAHSRYHHRRRSPERSEVKAALQHYEACAKLLGALRDKYKV